MKKKVTSKFMALALALMMVVVFIPSISFAAEGETGGDAGSTPSVTQDDSSSAGDQVKDESSQTEVSEPENTEEPAEVTEDELKPVKAAPSAKITVTVNNKGVIAKTKSGAAMADKTVTVTDRDKDGKLTVDEALYAAHKSYSSTKNYATTETAYGKNVSKLWGVKTGNALFFVNDKGLTTGVGTDTVKAGDRLYASINQDEMGNDWYTTFDSASKDVLANEEFTLNLSGHYGMSWGDYSNEPVEGIQIGTWSKGKFKALEGATTDEDGNIKLSFAKVGTYYVTAKGTVAGTYWMGEAVDCPIMAPMCVVKVSAAPSAKITVSVSNKGVIAKAKNGSAMADKTVTVVDRNKDGKLTVDEALYAAHKAYSTTKNYATADTAYGKNVTKLWGVKTQNVLMFVNDKGLSAGVGTDTVKAGDRLYASINSDEMGNDWYTTFDQSDIKTMASDEITLNLSGHYGMAWGDYSNEPVEGIQIGTWSKGKFTALEGAKTDEDGNVKLTFKKAGTYYVTAKGTVAGTNWSGKPAECPTMAPMCVVRASAAPNAKITVTVNNKGVVAKTRSGAAMAGKTVTATDRNIDGILTVDEALYAAHKAYSYTKNYATSDTAYGKSVTKLWGVKTTNVLMFVNDKGLTTGVGTDTVKAGDRLYASINQDEMGNDWYTTFDKMNVETKVKTEFQLNLSGHYGMSWGDYSNEPAAGVQIGTWSKGKFKALEGVTTDDAGNAKLTFKKTGTYYVTAKGTVAGTDWMEQAVDCPIMAPMCVVKVTK